LSPCETRGETQSSPDVFPCPRTNLAPRSPLRQPQDHVAVALARALPAE